MDRFEQTPCEQAPWVVIPIHNSLRAYNMYRCQCPTTLRLRHEAKRRWASSPRGRAYAERYAASRRVDRGPDGLTTAERDRAARRAHGERLLRAGTFSQPEIAERVGVDVRTVQRWVRQLREPVNA